jgi:chromosome partitioning protein
VKKSRPLILTVANQKGGVGKTTTTMNIGIALARAGRRVLLIDGDPQANLTSYLGVTPGAGDWTQLHTLDEVYLSKRPLDAASLDRFFARTKAGVDLLAADTALSGVEYYLFSRSDRERVLANFLTLAEGRYDYVLIDTPPSLSLLTLNALAASRGVLVPVQPEFFSLEGIVKIRQAISDIRARFNPELEILGVLATQVARRRKLTDEVLEILRGEVGPLLFEAMIHENAAVAESSGHGQSILDYDRSSLGARDYVAAALELIGRCESGTSPRTAKGDNHELENWSQPLRKGNRQPERGHKL